MKKRVIKFFWLMFFVSFFFVLVSCVTTKVASSSKSNNSSAKNDYYAIERGISSWNSRGPSSAAGYWNEIKNQEERKIYLNYISLYDSGVETLSNSNSVSSENALFENCQKTLKTFSLIDDRLYLPVDICEQGAQLSCDAIIYLIGNENAKEAINILEISKKLYGDVENLNLISRDINIVKPIIEKAQLFKNKNNKIKQINDLDLKIDESVVLYNEFLLFENESLSTIKRSGISKNQLAIRTQKNLKKLEQDLAVQKELVIREKSYKLKENIGKAFAKQPENLPIGKKSGIFTLEEILKHYQSVKNEIDSNYNQLVAFKLKYPKDVQQSVVDEANELRTELSSKITLISKEIATQKEIASRGKTVMPLMIGLFNPDSTSKGDDKKSYPSKFSSNNGLKDEYYWGMVSIPKGEMNDLVITMSDTRNVRVFNENTKSGKLIEKNNLKDLVSRGSRVGNSWPVLNAGAQLKGNNYYFEVQKGKLENYSGDVVVYSSFITRMR